MRCERCYEETMISTGSMFNTQQICVPCEEREKAHPDYEKARKVEGEAVRGGDLNFPGIGLPSDLN